ncbi:MAG: hypothetical protein J6S43_05110 [Lentisphaeria bacterium]|nr:hypothetical protein [Lentisphaeria bacterium]
MNRAILIVICDFLVSAMLTMMTGMVPGHTGGTGVGLDESTTKVLLNELNRRQLELEAMRLHLRDAIARSGSSFQQEEELRRITAELTKNLAQQEQLSGKLVAGKSSGPGDPELRVKLEAEEAKRKKLEDDLEKMRRDLAGKAQLLAEVSGKLYNEQQGNAVLHVELVRTRDNLSDTGKKLESVRDDLMREKEKLSAVREKLAVSESNRKNAEKSARESAAQLSAVRQDLSRTRQELLDESRSHGRTREKLAVSESRRESAEKTVQRTAGELSSTRKERDDERSAHSETRTELARKESELRTVARDLRSVRTGLNQLETAHSKSQVELNKLKLVVAQKEGRLESSELSNAELKDENIRLRRELVTAKLERQDAVTQRDMMKETVKDTVLELSAERQKLELAQKETVRLDATIKALELVPGSGGGASDSAVFEHYAGAIVKVDARISEKAFMGERTGRTASYYPVVDFGGGRIMVVGALNRFAGDWDTALKFEKVLNVAMDFSLPFAEGQSVFSPAGGNMLVNNVYPHMAAFICSGGNKNIRPLKVADAAVIRQRGVEDLFLFKSGSYEANTRLNGRVSLIAGAAEPALFIRNVGRSGLSAEPGDMILSGRGELVGIVSERMQTAGASGVRVPLFANAGAGWDQPVIVPLTKTPQDEYFNTFAAAMRELRKKVRPGYDKL